jgi:hypothetical protein
LILRCGYGNFICGSDKQPTRWVLSITGFLYPYNPTVEAYGTVEIDLAATPSVPGTMILMIEGSYVQAGLGHTIGKLSF